MSPKPTPALTILTQWFDPEPTFKGLVFARAMQARGYRVEVVTGFPNYPGGHVYEGYRIRAIQREYLDGIKVTRLPLYPSHNSSGFKRALNYLSFMLSSFIYMTFWSSRPDVVYVYHPPLTVALSAIMSNLLRRAPLVLDIQDMWPDTLGATGMVRQGRILSLIGRACDWIYSRASHIVVLCPGFARLLEKRGVNQSKISVIYNWADERSVGRDAPARPRTMPDTDRFQILFAGNIGKAQALVTVLDAATLLETSGAAVDFVFLGSGLELEVLKAEAKARNLANVTFLPRVGMQQVGAYLQAADALLVHLRNDPLFSITVPSKTQAYMAAGKPIIMGVAGDAAKLVETAGCGVTFDPENAGQLAAAAIKLAKMQPNELARIGQSGAQFYDRNLSLDVGADAFDHVFRLVLSDRARRFSPC